MKPELMMTIQLAVIILYAAFWCYQFSDLMMLSDRQFFGKYDKIIWAAAFIIVSPLAPFAYLFWKKAVEGLRR
ncbi:MAG: hypothetical protein JXR40_13900 [Pontiellaceae bacterium]|nr:hypothetical protein [Pontiellaceae bacterium]